MTRDRGCRVVPLGKILCDAGYRQKIFAPSQVFPKHDKLSKVVVGCDGGDEPSDVEGSTVIFGHVRQLEPEEDCGASHTSDAERQRVVDKAQLAIGEAVWKWCHFCK